MRRLFSRHGARWLIGVLLTLLAVAISLEMLQVGAVERIDQVVYDTRLNLLSPKLDPRIVVLDIDEKSLDEIGRWPWGRNKIAMLVDQLFDHYKVKAVGFDVLFTEPDISSGYPVLESLSRQEFKDIPAVAERLRSLKSRLDYDGLLAKSIKGRPVVLSFQLSDTIKKGLLPHPAFTVADLKGLEVKTGSFKGHSASLAELQNSAMAGGYMNTNFDEAGFLRSTPLFLQFNDGYYESLALATARVALGATTVQPLFFEPDAFNSKEVIQARGVLKGVALNSEAVQTKIPLEDGLTVRINYRGIGGPDGGAFRYISAADVLKGRLPTADLAQKIVLVGTTASGLFDLRATPVNSAYPGVEVHANIIKSILDNDFKMKPDWDQGFDFVQVILVGIMLVIALSLLTPAKSMLFTLCVVTGVMALNNWMYQTQHLVMPVATCLLLIASLFIFNIAWGYLFEHRKGRAMVNLFGEYVAPELVSEMAQDPEAYNMEGDSRQLSVMFADVRGFTTISESLEPNVLREYVNLYLTAMSEIIRGNRGTLDKYIGDCVMAFWGAPVSLPDHASRSVATALMMQKTAHELSASFVERGWPPLAIGIGVNTGEMRVGDMGSKIRKAYTVMGDAVNLSSRLEAITKVYGVGVVVGEATMLAAPEFAYRELDRVRVKGKNEPVPIFEPIARLAELTPEQKNNIEQWHQALALFRAQQWASAEEIFHKLQRADSNAVLYSRYLNNVMRYREHPPGADWDGVTTFATKDG